MSPCRLRHGVIAYAFFNFIGFAQQMRSHVSTQPHAVSTDTTMPHTLHVYLLPFGTTGFLATLAAGLAVVFAAGFAAAFALGAGFLAAGLAAAFAAGFAAGLLFVAIVLPPLIFFAALILYFMHIKDLVKKRFHNQHKKMLSPRRLRRKPMVQTAEILAEQGFCVV
jgi:phosphate/sulfate permease